MTETKEIHWKQDGITCFILTFWFAFDENNNNIGNNFLLHNTQYNECVISKCSWYSINNKWFSFCFFSNSDSEFVSNCRVDRVGKKCKAKYIETGFSKTIYDYRKEISRLFTPMRLNSSVYWRISSDTASSDASLLNYFGKVARCWNLKSSMYLISYFWHDLRKKVWLCYLHIFIASNYLPGQRPRWS